MEVTCLDCFSDDFLCCEEDSSGVLSVELTDSSSDIDYPAGLEESVAELIEEERKFVPGEDYVERFQSRSLDHASSREESVAWILKVHSFYGFLPLTAYLTVNYFDRFLYARNLPERNGWPLQLLSIACLSLAAKMEEPLVPSLLDLQIEGTKYIFEPRTIQRMEFLVLGVLDWRLRSITPFTFLSYFAYKLDPAGAYTGFLISKATQIIMSNIKEVSLLEYRPSCIAAATMLSAAQCIPNLSVVSPDEAESWCDGLVKEKISGCYRLIEEWSSSVGKRSPVRNINYPPKVLPKVRVMSRAWVGSGESSSSSSSFSSIKRRKLNNSLWVDEDKTNSDSEEKEL
ncbi:cyclin-D1-1 [Impatiens glandulifera]|uniref:cyclin-D1-1 n=1 Tax=Impatiens glandulifera TaxID=253017 RepID=UPI001FB13700|nr:cyclin-D1-1 [Impatiens glandulifera]